MRQSQRGLTFPHLSSNHIHEGLISNSPGLISMQNPQANLISPLPRPSYARACAQIAGQRGSCPANASIDALLRSSTSSK